jgi:hypothetical protein
MEIINKIKKRQRRKAHRPRSGSRSSYGNNQQNQKQAEKGFSACERELVTIHIATYI